MEADKPRATRRSRKTGNFVTPQRATQDAWYNTFSEWALDRQATALEVLGALHRQAKRLTDEPEDKQEPLP